MASEGTTAAAYGFRVDGLEADGWLALHDAEGWPGLCLAQRREPFTGKRLGIFAGGAAFVFTYGTLVVGRADRSVVVHAARPLPVADLVHPCLWPGAALLARWEGWETFHGGAFLDRDGAAWIVLGESGAGKSSLLAALAVAGREVLTDDLVVVRDGRCLAGPRCVDLRLDAAAALGLDGGAAIVRSTSRRRLALPPIAGAARLGGWLLLEWGDGVALEPVPTRERVSLLARHRRVVGLGEEPVALLDLAGRPALRLTRPRALGGLSGVVAPVLEAVDAGARHPA